VGEGVCESVCGRECVSGKVCEIVRDSVCL
jgi:hypothetical protein